MKQDVIFLVLVDEDTITFNGMFQLPRWANQPGLAPDFAASGSCNWIFAQ